MGRPSKLLPFPSRLVQDPGAQGIISPNLERAGATTRVDPQAAAAPALGMAKVGAGLQDLGTATGQLAQVVEKAQTVTAEYKSAEEMEKAKFDINAAIQQEQDQSKWPGIIDARLGQLSSTVQGLPNVPDSARPALDHKLAMFGIDVRGGAQDHAVRKSIGDAIDSGNAVVKRAGATGDLALGESTIDGMVQKHYITPEMGNLKKVELKDDVKKVQDNTRANTFLGVARVDPKKAMEYADSKDFPGDEVQRAKFRNIAQQEMREGTAAATQQAQDMLAQPLTLPDGKQNPEFISSPEQFDTWRKDDPLITPEIRQQAKAAWTRQQNSERKQHVAANAPAIASRLYTEVQEFNGTNPGDPDTIAAYTDLSLRIGELPPDSGGYIKSQLEAKMKNKPAPVDKTLQGTAHRMSEAKFQNNFFGKWQWQEPVVDGKTGKPVMNEHTHQPETKHVIDLEAKERALSRKAQYDMEITGEIQRNPKWADSPTGVEDLSKVMQNRQSIPMLAGWIDTVTGLHPAPTAGAPGETARPKQKLRVVPKADVVPEDAKAPEYTAPPPTTSGSSIADQVIAGEDKTPKGSADVGNADLFPVGEGGNVVGGDNMLLPLPEDVPGDLPSDRKKRKR